MEFTCSQADDYWKIKCYELIHFDCQSPTTSIFVSIKIDKLSPVHTDDQVLLA